MNIQEVLFIFLVYIFGTLLSLVITGFLVNRLVIRKVMQNKDIQDIIRLFREGKEYLRELLENQKISDTQ